MKIVVNRKALVWLIILGLALRLGAWYGYFQNNPLMTSFDSGHYHRLATSLSKAQGFVGEDKQPSLYRLPGYPLFVAGCYALHKRSPRTAIILQICISLALIPLTMMIAGLLFPMLPNVSFIAGLLSAVSPGYIIYSNLLMSETLFLFFFLLFLYLFLFFLNRMKLDFFGYPRCRRLLFFSGLFFGVASLIRPVGHLMLPFVLIEIVAGLLIKKRGGSYSNSTVILSPCNGREDPGPRKSGCSRRLRLLSMTISECFLLQIKKSFFNLWRTHRCPRIFTLLIYSLAFLIGWISIVGWWLLRNYLLTGMLVFHTLSGPHFLNHLGVKIIMQRDAIGYVAARDKAYSDIDQQREQQSFSSDVQRSVVTSRLMEAYTKSLVLSNPMIAAKILAINMIKTMFGLYSSELLVIESGGHLPAYESSWRFIDSVKRFLLPPVSWPIRFVIYYELLFMVFIIIGTLGFFLQQAFCYPGQTIGMLFLVLFFIGIASACGFARLRFPIEWCLMLWAALWWEALLQEV
jgi:hypothetical protein